MSGPGTLPSRSGETHPLSLTSARAARSPRGAKRCAATLRRGNASDLSAAFELTAALPVIRASRTRDALARLALRDSLTGLPNRALLLDRIEMALADRQRGGRPIWTMFLDLDGFKEVNDSLGHAAGDQLLVEVAARLSRGVRASDTVARLGGDEFVIVCAETSRRRTWTGWPPRLLVSLAAPISVLRRRRAT